MTYGHRRRAVGPDGIMSAVRPGAVLAMHATVGPAYVQDLATSIPVYAAIGPEEFSIRAWPTLHKDVALMEALGGPATQLVDAARATIADMEVRRADFVASRSRT
jgi:hypothetical protein